MKYIVILFVAALTFGACLSEDAENVEGDGSNAFSGLESAACVFSCLERFERKGVEGDLSSSSLDLEGSVCQKLDLDALVSMCSSYQKASTCFGQCVNNPTKKIITSGLDYICVRHLEDFKKYIPCYKKQCPVMEQQCGKRCGIDLDTAEGKWMAQLGLTNSTTDEQKTSRKRRQSEDTTSEPETTTTPTATDEPMDASGDGSSAIVDPSDPLYSCQFVKCYMTCSRPILENECGKEAYDLLRETSNILLSFVMAPMEESWETGSNTSLTGASSICDNYFSEALKDENLDRTVLKSSSTRRAYNTISTVLLFTTALAMIYHF